MTMHTISSAERLGGCSIVLMAIVELLVQITAR